MVKTRQQGGRAIPEIAFDRGRAPGVEVIGLRDLVAREARRDLSRPQRPTFHCVFFVTRGPGTHTVDFQRHRLTAGHVLHVAPGQVQQFGLERALDARLVVFEPDFVARAPGPRVSSAPRLLSRARRATVAALCEAIEREHAQARALVVALVEALVRAIDVEPPAPAREADALLERFAAALEGSFTRAREVAAYAAMLDCSTRTLSRACEHAAGRSAKRLIDERVALEARRLLAHGSRSAAEISAQLGFVEPTQFGKFFRRLAGTTPAKFRARFTRSILRS
jgi:AraC-like DNA-binding protein